MHRVTYFVGSIGVHHSTALHKHEPLAQMRLKGVAANGYCVRFSKISGTDIFWHAYEGFREIERGKWGL